MLFWLDRGYRLLTVIGVLQIFYLFVNSEYTLNTIKYTAAFNILHLIIIGLIVSVVVGVWGWVVLYRKNRKVVDVVSLLLVVYFGAKMYVNVRYSCDSWREGITGEMEDWEGQCKIRTPKVCWYWVVNGLFDFTGLLKNSHLSSEDDHNFRIFYKEPLEKGDYIGLPNPKIYS